MLLGSTFLKLKTSTNLFQLHHYGIDYYVHHNVKYYTRFLTAWLLRPTQKP